MFSRRDAAEWAKGKSSQLVKPCVVSSVLAVERAQCTTSYSAVSDDDMHKLPASRDERADGGHGSESLL